MEAFDTIANYQNNIQNLNSIVNNEEERLQQKRKTVDDALFTQNRMIEFNESLRKRYSAFNYIVITFVVAFIMIFLLLLLNRFFPFIPVAFFISVILGIAIIVSFSKYYNISSRWNMDYDIYNHDPPLIQHTTTSSDLTNGGSVPTPTLASCIGSKCCSEGTTWCPLRGVCEPNKEEYKNMYADEFENYSRL
jgi:hypothetical protein